ncbi:MAG: site-2 protease family protein [Bryobacteraceae bacterium]|nr:site-2 protease family protein [Bryobacteraceae bacterium]
MTPTARDRASIPGTLMAIRLFGVPVRLHFTFILLAIFLLMFGLSNEQSNLMFAFYVFGLFASVLLHELGHALVARRYGIGTTEIVMFPIGGVARLERNPKPAEEFWIAIAGPLVNVVIFAVIFGYLQSRHLMVPVQELVRPTDANLLARIGIGNLILAAFNLIPAFPMDGGRILRSILARFRPEDEATRLAAGAGRMLAMIMGLYGLLNAHFFLVFIAFFVYLGAAQESAAAMGRVLTHGIPVRAAMVSEFHTLSHGHTIRDAANLLLATSQQDFPVVHAGKVVGLLTRNKLLRSMATEGPEAYVAGVMEREFTSLAPAMDLAEALPVMARAGSCALVMEGDHLLGLLTAENLSEFLLLRRFGMELPQPVRS